MAFAEIDRDRRGRSESLSHQTPLRPMSRWSKSPRAHQRVVRLLPSIRTPGSACVVKTVRLGGRNRSPGVSQEIRRNARIQVGERCKPLKPLFEAKTAFL